MRLRFSILLAALVLWALTRSLPSLHTSHSPTPPAPPETFPVQVNSASTEPSTPPALSEMTLRLDDLVYQLGDGVSATLDLGKRELNDDASPTVLLSSPDSGDVEILSMRLSDEVAVYQGIRPVPTALFSEDDPVLPYDGVLTLMPGEIFHAVWLVDGLAHTDATEPPLLSDFGVTDDSAAVASLPVDVVPDLTQWDSMPAMEKPFGTLLSQSGTPLQVALNELIVAPRDRKQLDELLVRTGGRIVRSDLLPEEQGQRDPRYYLMEVDTTSVDLAELPTLRRLMGQTGFVAADSEEVLRTLALTMELRLEGYPVGVNPRLRYAGVPGISLEEQGHLRRNMTTFGPMNVPQLWAFMALWDRDETRIPAAILDMGFAPNLDFREPIVQCDMEAGTLADGLACGPGVAVGPPTVGNSFFGSFSWHGNGVVTTAGGVINNGWGSAGVGGQVVEPMLYRYGLASYAFEMGLGIRKATMDGASVINLSASYPCTLLTEFDIGISYCRSGERVVLCTLISTGLGAAVETICGTIPFLLQVPVVGPALASAALEVCNTGRAVVAIAATACYGTLLLGDLKGNLEEAVAFATEQGVPIVNSAGNELSRSSLPEFLQDLIDVDNTVADDWDQIPGVIPDVISAGAVGDYWPFANIHFYGPSVDLWAPIRSTYYSPPTTDVVTGSEDQIPRSIGGTSAAAPYIAGLIACMQAVNPELHPGTPGLTPAQRAQIVPRITALLLDHAWSNDELVTMAPASQSAAVAAAASERRNMINPLRAIQAAAVGALPDAAAMGYDTLLDADETSPSTAADTEADARLVSLGDTVTGSIITIRGEDGAPDLQDVDWFRFSVPSGRLGFYTARFKLTVPRGFGVLTTDTPGYLIEPSVLSTPDEEIFLIASPALAAGADGAFRIAPVLDSDNVYKLEYLEASLFRLNPTALPNVQFRPRATTKSARSFRWPATGAFRAVVFLPRHELLIATVTTVDGSVVKSFSIPPGTAALQTASLDVADLRAGDYCIELSHPARLLLPDAATADGDLSLETAAAGPQAKPPHLRLQRAANHSIATWPLSALRYQLEGTDDPTQGEWTPVVNRHRQYGGSYLCELPLSDSVRFYRLRETQ